MTTQLSDAGVTFADGNTQVYPSVPVRQTVLSGPVDATGQSAFGGATGSTVVTAAGTLVATAANGLTNRTGSKINPSWVGLSTNGTMYLFADVNADGTITEGTGTLAPIYQWGGTPATTAGLFTYNIQQSQGFIGNGTTAPAGYRVYVGEVTVAAGVVSAIVWYALMGRYFSGYTNTLPSASSATVKSHNLGIDPSFISVSFLAKNITADSGFVADDIMLSILTTNTSIYTPPTPRVTRKAVTYTSSSNANPWAGVNVSTGSYFTLTMASWAYAMTAQRGF